MAHSIPLIVHVRKDVIRRDVEASVRSDALTLHLVKFEIQAVNVVLVLRFILKLYGLHEVLESCLGPGGGHDFLPDELSLEIRLTEAHLFPVEFVCCSILFLFDLSAQHHYLQRLPLLLVELQHTLSGELRPRVASIFELALMIPWPSSSPPTQEKRVTRWEDTWYDIELAGAVHRWIRLRVLAFIREDLAESLRRLRATMALRQGLVHARPIPPSGRDSHRAVAVFQRIAGHLAHMRQ